ncbi:DnaD domain protein [Lachnospiraceae bacterium WCA-9-b2]|uniref:DnaD domain protein n=1 Tax=Sporofaciens musculi TaxID=2681861 RepID=A0A7X3SLL8_9FIRM|nr:DnaD domain protein [Sporofaciens musculi]MXP78804.1 DnaD domain protein [Sporofaciens musculi]
MTKLTLTNYALGNTTVLENEFIDHHMVKANGEYVKVYLLLLRHMNRPDGMMSVSEMADILECTENDVRRALKYWKKQELLDYCEQTETGNAASIPVSAEKDNIAVVPTGRIERSLSDPANTDYTVAIPACSTSSIAADLADLKPAASEAPNTNIQQYRSRNERKEFKELLFVAEQYLGKTLSSVDIDMITYFYDTLHMSAELIEYLIEYCVENGHKSMHYIQKVALSWNEQKIITVSEAKSSTVLYNKNCYSILNAYGIKGRAPAPSEIAYIRRWNDEYGFSLDLILEACNRTMNTIHQPNFEYTDTILKNWREKNVRHSKDIDALDANYMKEKERRKKSAVKTAATSKSSKNNKFNNFSGRSYDMDSLERRLVQQ